LLLLLVVVVVVWTSPTMLATAMMPAPPATATGGQLTRLVVASAAENHLRGATGFHAQVPSQASAGRQSKLRLAAAVGAAAVLAGGISSRRRRLRARCRGRTAAAAGSIDSPDWESLDAIKELATPDRSAALSRSSSTKLRGIQKTPEEVIPADILASKHGKTLAEALGHMTEILNILALGTLILENAKDKSTVGLHGFELDATYVRKGDNGVEVTMPAAACLVFMMKYLSETFPDDPVLCNIDGGVLAKDEEFATTTATFLSYFGLIDNLTPQKAAEWVRHCDSYPKDAETPPKRYWVFNPIDSTQEFRTAKQYCCTLALMEDNEPVLSLVGCPVLAFDHASRSVPHASGSPIFWAVKGMGAWTQNVIMEREVGVYQGKYGLRGSSMQLKVGEKIKRGNDGLYDMLGTDQLRIAQGSRMREDIFLDSERVGKILGSEFPKFHFCDNSIKYCWLARGDEDLCWYLRQGFYDKSCTETMVDHAAGSLIAAESGASIADLDGKPVDWTTGPILSNNRGMACTDPNKIPMMGLVNAIKSASVKSEELYDIRVEKRKEKARILRWIFNDLANHAETPEEKKGCETVKMRGNELLDNETEMDKITQASMNRERPILGEGPQRDDTFDGDGSIPMTPIN